VKAGHELARAAGADDAPVAVEDAHERLRRVDERRAEIAVGERLSGRRRAPSGALNGPGEP
jgi:hypothetical protein